MAIFRYRMQNILNIKEKLETQEKQNFAMMRLRLSEEEERLSAMRVKRVELSEEARKIRLEKLDFIKIKESDAMLKYQEELIKQQTLKVRAAQKNLEAARVRMQQAVQEREIQDKLREKAFDEFMQEENMKEAKEIDELTSYTYGKKSGEQ